MSGVGAMGMDNHVGIGSVNNLTNSSTDMGMHMEAAGASPTMRLFFTLLSTFAAILLGFVCKRLRLIRPEEGDLKGLGFYTGQIALPLLIFKTVATAGLGRVNMGIIAACTLGKLCVMVITWVLVFFAYKGHRPVGQQVLTASTFAFFTVASNDFAIGFPVVDALYGRTVNMGAYIAVNAVVGSLLFVPGTSALFAIGKTLRAKEQKSEPIAQDTQMETEENEQPEVDKVGSAGSAVGPEFSQGPGCWASVTALLTEVIMNPIISFTLLGLLFKATLGWSLKEDQNTGDLRLPSPLHEVIALFAAPFGMSALFLTGASLRSAQIQLWPVALVLMKVVVCAYLSYFFGSLFFDEGHPVMQPSFSDMDGDGSEELVSLALRNFPFFYGAIPSSSAPLLFALQFDPGAADMIATAVLFGLILAGPILFVTAIFLQNGQQSTMMEQSLISNVQLNVSIGSVICGLIFVGILAMLRQDWGFSCPGRTLIVVYGLVALVYEVIMVSFNPHVGGTWGCEAYIRSSDAPIKILLGWLQNVLRLILIALFMMQVGMWSRPDYKHNGSVMGALTKVAAILGVISLLSLIPAFLVDTNTLLGVCQVNVENAIGGSSLIFRNVMYSSLLLLTLGGIAAFGIVGRRRRPKSAHFAQEMESGSSSISGSGEESSEDSDHPENPWSSSTRSISTRAFSCQPPSSVVKPMAMYEAVVCLTQVVNSFQVYALTSIRGSFTGMLILEMILAHGQLVFLVGVLIFNNSFVAQLHLSVLHQLPRMLYWWRRREIDMVIFYVPETDHAIEDVMATEIRFERAKTTSFVDSTPHGPSRVGAPQRSQTHDPGRNLRRARSASSSSTTLTQTSEQQLGRTQLVGDVHYGRAARVS